MPLGKERQEPHGHLQLSQPRGRTGSILHSHKLYQGKSWPFSSGRRQLSVGTPPLCRKQSPQAAALAEGVNPL